MIIRLKDYNLPEHIRKLLKVQNFYALEEGLVIRKNDQGCYIYIPNALVLNSPRELTIPEADRVVKAANWVELSQQVKKIIPPGEYIQGMITAWVLESPTGGSDISISGPSYQSVAGLFCEIVNGTAQPKSEI